MGKVCSRPEEKPEEATPELRLKKDYKERVIEIYFGDITRIEADAITSSGNYELSNNAGLALSISHRGGAEIHKECQKILEQNAGQVNIGNAYLTTAGTLKAKNVIHVICPMYTGGQHREAELLGSGITAALEKADEFGLTSIAIPSLATGLFGFPKELCADVIVKKTFEYIDTHQQSVVKTIKFVNHDNPTCLAFVASMDKVLPPPEEVQPKTEAKNEPETGAQTQTAQEVPAEMTKSKYPEF